MMEIIPIARLSKTKFATARENTTTYEQRFLCRSCNMITVFKTPHWLNPCFCIMERLANDNKTQTTQKT